MAVRDIGWDTIAAGGSTNWFIHGFASNESVVFSIVVFPGEALPGVPFPAAHATLAQGESFEHVDGTKAYKIYIQNHASFNACDVHILAQVEALPVKAASEKVSLETAAKQKVSIVHDEFGRIVSIGRPGDGVEANVLSGAGQSVLETEVKAGSIAGMIGDGYRVDIEKKKLVSLSRGKG